MSGLPVKPSQLFAQDASLTFGTGPERQKLEARFWSKVQKGNNNECWVWIGPSRDGYGMFNIDQRIGSLKRCVGAHRISYWLYKGPSKEGLEIDHLCRNRACVNPHHLESVEPWVNQMRSRSVTSKETRWTHCKNGHPFDLFNTYYLKGTRYCRICAHDRSVKYRNNHRFL